jgi:hypothetical protein
MPDWAELVRHQLSGLGLEPEVCDEVILELANHLEEQWGVLRGQGISKEAAVEQTLSLVEDWKDLGEKIQSVRAKEPTMNQRTREFWLPGFLTLLLAMGLLALIQFFGPKPWNLAQHINQWTLVAPVTVIYVPWLLSLPLVGALGAYLSNRAGGTRRAVIASLVFPVLPYLVFFLFGFPLALMIEENVTHNIMFSALLVGLFAWVLAPGAALVVGGLLAQPFLSRPSGSRQITSN